jgi:hypothetical protein
MIEADMMYFLLKVSATVPEKKPAKTMGSELANPAAIA